MILSESRKQKSENRRAVDCHHGHATRQWTDCDSSLRVVKQRVCKEKQGEEETRGRGACFAENGPCARECAAPAKGS